MKKEFSFLSFVIALCLFSFTFLFAQKTTTDKPIQQLAPLSMKDSISLVSLPQLTLPFYLKESSKTELPAIVDNSANDYWRPVFEQLQYECGQASGVGMGFTYAINRLRDLPSDMEDNQYPSHFCWNFANGGDGYYGVSYFHSFEIIKNEGTPDVDTYGGMAYGGPTRWMSGYDNYYQAMHNRLSEVFKIDVSTEEGILTAKHWIHNHLEESEVGGVANFYTNAPYGMSTLPDDTPEEGKYVVTGWSYANHGLTISGYHDSICWDYNNDGEYSNNIDLNGDGEITPQDWEIGGFRFANTYDWNPIFGNEGFSYMTYKSAADPYGSGGIWDNAIHVLYAKENTEPLLTAKISLKHTCRSQIRVRMGVSTDTLAENPEYILGFPIFDFQGGCNHMQGDNTEEDKTIEFGLDITPFLNILGSDVPARYFLLVDENDPNNWSGGMINYFSVLDYTGDEVNELSCLDSNIVLMANDLTMASVTHTTSFDAVEVDNSDLPPATVMEPYSAQLFGEGGTEPYIWEKDLNFSEIYMTNNFPEVDDQELYTGGYYTSKDLDFVFPFFGNEFDAIRVYQDGYIMFEDYFDWPYSVYDFFNFTKNKIIAPFQADLSLNSGNDDGVWFEGNSDSATIRWQASVTEQSSSELNFAVRLYADGDMKFFYGQNEFEDIDWISGISAGDNKYYQFTEISNQNEVPEDYLIDLKSSRFPEEFEVTRNGLFKGTAMQVYEDFEVTFRVTDENNLSDSRTLLFSTDGASYLIVEDIIVVAGDDDVIEYGETVYLTVDIKNLGQEAIDNIEMSIIIDDEYIILVDDHEYLGDFNAGETKTFETAFEFDINNLIPDEHIINFNTMITGEEGEEWNNHIYLTANSPVLFIGGVNLDDGDNGILDPGETVDLILTIKNSGGAKASNIETTLSSSDINITITTGSISIDTLYSNGQSDIIFNITASEDITIGYPIEFEIEMIADSEISASDNFNIIAGQIPVLVVNLAGNSGSAEIIKNTIDDIGVGVDQMNSIPTSLDEYASVFVCLGVYSDNHLLSIAEGDILNDYLDNGGCLYMEGGDTWAYDASTSVHAKFKIDGISDGAGDLGIIKGKDNTFTEGMSFSYNGGNSWIDHLEAQSSADVILQNNSPSYGTAIAYDDGDYKTIGASHEFGGLVDGNLPSTKEEVMLKYLEFFGVATVQLTASYYADQNEICQEGQVNFTDISIGNIQTWNWEFEGGEPETSTEQNPTVVYGEPGFFDVSLTVSDGASTNVIESYDFITVLSLPGMPSTLTGETEVCTNILDYSYYSTSGAENSDSYSWFIEPEEAGTVSGEGTIGTVEWTDNWTGLAFIKVKGINLSCGEGEFSDFYEVECKLCSGMEEVASENIFHVYPNPSDGSFVIIANSNVGKAELNIRNIINEEIYTDQIVVNGNMNYPISMKNFSKGIYFVEIKTKDNRWIKKVIVK